MWTCSMCVFPAMTWACRISLCRRTWKSSSACLFDLVPKEGLHRVIRDQVLADAQVLYAA